MSNTVKLNNCPQCGAPIPAGAPQGLCPKCVLLGAATATEAGVPATATSEIPSLERVAAAFPQLEVLELIGRGGMGFVFKARQPHLDRFVALKLLPDKLARDPRFTERFNREGRVLAKLNHPNIVSVYDFGQTEHFYFLTMEYVDGVNLRQAMKAGRFSPGEALAIVPKICDALQYAHGQGILHRDIKPENILLDARGQVKIADFGIAKLVGDDKPDVALTATGAALGTPHYMAPEQLEKPLTVDHRADIYSLGVVFYEMLTGELPIGRFAAPSSKTPVGANVDEVVFRTLEKDRERRYQSVGEMKTQVEHLTGAGAGNYQAAPPKLSGTETVVAPKWSQKAVWGAVLTGLSLPLPLVLLTLAYLAKGGRTLFGVVELVIFAGMTFLPGLAGTILGWMALSDIRAQQGRLRGLPLAVPAALGWPLVVLVCGTLVWPLYVLRSSTSVRASPTFSALLPFLILAGAVTFAIWAVYAAARWGMNKPATHRRGVLKWVFIALMLSGTGFLLMNTLPRGKRHHVAPAFAAVIERVLPEPAPGVACLLDFETGLLITPSQDFALGEKLKNGLPDIGEESVRWLRDSGVDAAVNIPNRGTLRLFEGVALSFSRNQDPPLTWDQFTPADVTEALGKAGWEQGRRFLNSDRTFYETPAVTPNALAFITREGSMGLLEVMGPSAKPRGVKIRYKLMPPLTVPPAIGKRASAELWSHKLAPGEKPNLGEILQEAKRLAEEGRNEEALQRHIWYHNHALEIDPAQSGVRVSFALAQWTDLASRYPKAKEALVEIRDRGARQLAGGGGYFGLFQEVRSINLNLGQEDATLALFKSIQARDPKLARQCYAVAEELLVEKGDYALCASFIPDAQSRFETIRAQRERTLKHLDRIPEANRALTRKGTQWLFIEGTRTLIEILVGTGRKAEAETIRDQAVAVLDVPELQSAVADAEQNVERAKAAK